MPGIIPTYRQATAADVETILLFIRALADYEKMSDEVVTDVETLRRWIFEEHAAEVVFVCEEGREVGFAVYFYNFSTFEGRAGLYLEDLFVLPECRGKGYGKGLLTLLAKKAVSKGCARMEWNCLDWNQPSIDFYLSLGAQPMKDWTTYRLAGPTLEAAASMALGVEE